MNEIDQLVRETLKELGTMRFRELASDMQEHVAMRQFLKAKYIK